MSTWSRVLLGKAILSQSRPAPHTLCNPKGHQRVPIHDLFPVPVQKIPDHPSRLLLKLLTALRITGCFCSKWQKLKPTKYTLHRQKKRLRWSRGRVLAFGTQVHGFKPGRSRRIFQGEKILNTPSFGREVKPFVSCSIFTACKRALNITRKSGIFRQNSFAISRPSSSAFHC